VVTRVVARFQCGVNDWTELWRFKRTYLMRESLHLLYVLSFSLSLSLSLSHTHTHTHIHAHIHAHTHARELSLQSVQTLWSYYFPVDSELPTTQWNEEEGCEGERNRERIQTSK
jgi:hypothetical protein